MRIGIIFPGSLFLSGFLFPMCIKDVDAPFLNRDYFSRFSFFIGILFPMLVISVNTHISWAWLHDVNTAITRLAIVQTYKLKKLSCKSGLLFPILELDLMLFGLILKGLKPDNSENNVESLIF